VVRRTVTNVPEVVFSPAVVDAGTAFYYKVVDAGHEGVMAKLLNSAYRPGKRCNTWKKIKPQARKAQYTSEHC
jgi:ATP-dependent DNA ligase